MPSFEKTYQELSQQLEELAQLAATNRVCIITAVQLPRPFSVRSQPLRTQTETIIIDYPSNLVRR